MITITSLTIISASATPSAPRFPWWGREWVLPLKASQLWHAWNVVSLAICIIWFFSFRVVRWLDARFSIGSWMLPSLYCLFRMIRCPSAAAACIFTISIGRGTKNCSFSSTTHISGFTVICCFSFRWRYPCACVQVLRCNWIFLIRFIASACASSSAGSPPPSSPIFWR